MLIKIKGKAREFNSPVKLLMVQDRIVSFQHNNSGFYNNSKFFRGEKAMKSSGRQTEKKEVWHALSQQPQSVELK